jgi:hypothetical protein
MSVGELIACLRIFEDDTPVTALYDCGTAEGAVVAVALDEGDDSVMLTIE